MSLTILSVNAPDSAIRALWSVTPAVVDIECVSKDKLEEYTANVLKTLFAKKRSSEFGEGDTALIASEASKSEDSDMYVITVCIYGDYVSTLMDLESILESEKSDEIDFGISIDTEMMHWDSVDKLHYTYSDDEFVDWIVFIPRSGNTIKSILEKCVEWRTDKDITYGSEFSANRARRKLRTSKSKVDDMSTWVVGKAETPALWLAEQLSNIGASILSVHEDRDGDLHVSVKFDYEVEEYNRDPVINTIMELDEAALFSYKTQLNGTRWCVK